jgi:hypothetical protein
MPVDENTLDGLVIGEAGMTILSLIAAPYIYAGLFASIGFENMIHGPEELLGSFDFGFEKRDYSS